MNAEQPAPKGEGLSTDLPLACSLSRKCSNCGKTGHNSRTCLEIREAAASVSLEAAGDVITQVAEQHRQQAADAAREGDDGAASDDSTGVNHREGRKKGVAWTEEEHRLFLLGLQKLGKGDWRGISRHYVQSRSPTQVASHAQKYFIRQSIAGKRKRRSSLFDLVPETQEEAEATSPRSKMVKEEQKMHQPPQKARQPLNPSAGMMPGPDAFALACWYQSMMASQNPLSWMQAVYGQGQQNHAPLPTTPPILPPTPGFMMPQFMPQPGLPLMGLQAQEGQQAGLFQGQSMATAYMAQHQQQMAFAMAMIPPFNPDLLMQMQRSSEQAVNTGQALSMRTEAGTATADANNSYQPRSADQASTVPHKRTKLSSSASLTKEEVAPGSQFDEPDVRSRGESRAERLGDGTLVRPKAKKARPFQYGELPSYMQATHEGQSSIASGSLESHSTALKVKSTAAGLLPDFSGSTNEGFTGSSAGGFPLSASGTPDDLSATKGTKSGKSTPDRFPQKSGAGAG